jgi:hypothetical protein
MRKILLICFFIFTISYICFAQNVTYYDIAKGETKVIDEWGIAKTVTNNCQKNIYVPVKTETEWQGFINSAPACVLREAVVTCSADGDSCGIGTSCCSGFCRGGICELDACGACHWADIDCSHYGGIWSTPTVPCDPAHEGQIVMRNTRTGCGPQHLESYTSEYWPSRCFTGRAVCDCGTTEPSAPIHTGVECTDAGGEIVDTDVPGLKQCKFQASSCPAGWSKYKNWMTTKAAIHTGIKCYYGCCYDAPNTATNPGHGWSNNDAHYPLTGTWCPDNPSNASYDGCEGDGGVYCGAFQALGEITEIGCY